MAHSLAIGDYMYSSWSLRGWLMFDAFGIEVDVDYAHMRTPEFFALLDRYAPTRLVPAMRTDNGVVWDTLAMGETLNEENPDAGMLPASTADRAQARSLIAEMHSGFTALRGACPMNLRHTYPDFEPSDEVSADIARLEHLWSRCAGYQSGKWLFGAYTLADVMFAPVATRIVTYNLPVSAPAQAYVAAHIQHPSFLKWRALAVADGHVQEGYDLELPTANWPG